MGVKNPKRKFVKFQTPYVDYWYVTSGSPNDTEFKQFHNLVAAPNAESTECISFCHSIIIIVKLLAWQRTHATSTRHTNYGCASQGYRYWHIIFLKKIKILNFFSKKFKYWTFFMFISARNEIHPIITGWIHHYVCLCMWACTKETASNTAQTL